jgi:hypothetical protein
MNRDHLSGVPDKVISSCGGKDYIQDENWLLLSINFQDENIADWFIPVQPG